MKPIAMKCSQEQYEKIKPILLKNGFKINKLGEESKHDYLTNNYYDEKKLVGFTYLANYYDRKVFEEWNEDVFLEYCGIEKEFVLPKKWCIKGCKELKDLLNPCTNVIGDIKNFYYCNTTNCIDYLTSRDWNYFNSESPNFVEISVEQFQKYVLKQNTQTMQTLTLGQLKDLYSVSDCSKWHSTIQLYLEEAGLIAKDSLSVNIKPEHIQLLLKEGNTTQQTAVQNLGIKLSSPIEWDKIKTGSKVMLKYSGERCCGSDDNIDFNKPFDVIFFKQPYYMFNNGFKTCNSYIYCTFNQNGKFVCYQAQHNTDYIIEVIEY